MLKALIFDFDGLILDTETPEFEVIQEIYAEYDAELSIQKWGQIIGGSGAVHFDPVADLEQILGKKLPRQRVLDAWRAKANALIDANPILPGVMDILNEAQERGLSLAIASSSEHWWVDGHLKRLGIFERFEDIICSEDVTRTKPSPELFLLALSKLNTSAEQSIIFEDSPNGVRAAKLAGIPVVAVPNPITALLTFDPPPNWLFSSLTEFKLAMFL